MDGGVAGFIVAVSAKIVQTEFLPFGAFSHLRR